MSPSYPQIVVTGDSISQQAFKIGGYGAALVDAYQGKADVINRGMGGYNSNQLLKKLKDDFQWPNGDVKIAVIHIGTNDATTHGIQHVPVEDFTQNVKAILKFLKETQPEAKVILITPSTVDMDAWAALGLEMGMPSEMVYNRSPEAAKRIRDAVLAVAEEADASVVDAWKLHDDAVKNGELKTSELFSDGLHYSERGYAYINKALLQLINTSYPSLSPESMPEGFTMFALYGNENNPEAQRMVKVFTEKMEAIKQAALGNTK
ncbi:hypothetical protein QFC22_001415 [Naganishia vaughanmartiniae]|uniref:Uncharacterized protein n=1 Tax=Naganishia vaughanmartiniae TaxID=1424756 RepID=A0ACC2XJJ5_9TREE|nr:hypothetical protein QFC22_001415 [Naganishia vaughanmartiniae]